MDYEFPYEFIGFGAMDDNCLYEFIGFGARDIHFPYEFIGFGAIDATHTNGRVPKTLCFQVVSQEFLDQN